MTIHPTLVAVTDRIRARSAVTREAYLRRIDDASRAGPLRGSLSCTNLAHGFAAAPKGDKIMLREQRRPNIAIVSSYNDMLSAHQPLDEYPEWIKEAARETGATAQFAGGVPAMCDGVTQGQPGMELSLFSRDVIALATAVSLSHNMFDATLCLGICDKIVPGLLIGALTFGHLPTIFVPGGPMGSGLSNKAKAAVRQRYAAGEVGKDVLLQAESEAYHSSGTCTFYGTANSNQMLMEVMGLHLPGAAFVPPGTELREALTRQAARQAAAISREGSRFTPVGRMVDERTIANAIVALLATGGSTNHTMHLVAIARAAGIVIDWDDFDALSDCVPLLTRIYPNGSADVNDFHNAGGCGFLIGELIDAGLVHEDVDTVVGKGLSHYRKQPVLEGREVKWVAGPAQSGDPSVLTTTEKPFSSDGGLKVLDGNLGRAVTKVSAVSEDLRVIEAPARIFSTQEALIEAYKAGQLGGDFVAVVRFQGPKANGMPELHGLTPTLANLLDNGQRVALVTDGRMSGASGKVPAAIHVTPEACDGGALARLRDGDIIRVDAETGALEVKLSAAELAAREPAQPDLSGNQFGMGRELFGSFRTAVTGAEQGAMTFGLPA